MKEKMFIHGLLEALTTFSQTVQWIIAIYIHLILQTLQQNIALCTWCIVQGEITQVG